MSIYLSQEKDINVSLNPKHGIALEKEKRDAIASVLYKKYLNREVVNSVRSFAVCPVCKEYCTYVVDSKETMLSNCSLIERREGFNILIPVGLIHVLQRHNNLVDEVLTEYFS